MGMTFIADGAPEVSMSYIVLSRIRDAIAIGADKDFGFFYERDVDIPRAVMNMVDEDILCFLLQSDVNGELGYAACGKVAAELEKYRVQAGRVVLERRKNELQNIMEYCYTNKKTLRWE